MAKRDKPAQSYKQTFPAIGLSLERATPNVPDDGCFYVLLGGQIKGRYLRLKQAQTAYQALLQQSGYSPPSPAKAKANSASESVERYMDKLEDYWLESHRYTRRGGKTMYRG